MKYISVSEAAKKWNVSPRSVRNYCVLKKIASAKLVGKRWFIPSSTIKPDRINKRLNQTNNLLDVLRREKKEQIIGGIYHKLQIKFAYNSNHIEGSKLSEEQTRYIFETNSFESKDKVINVDDVLETINHFKCVDMIIDKANNKLNEKFILSLHKALKSSTSDSRKSWFTVGGYKQAPNEVAGKETTKPEDVKKQMKLLLEEYNLQENKTLEEILDFHYHFERIHPFQDGNGRVGRLIMFKECLRAKIVPFIISDELKLYYYRGLNNWKENRGYLIDTCLTAQERFKSYLDYFRIKY